MQKNGVMAASISNAELEILQILWDSSPLSADEIVDKLQEKKEAHPRTIKTLIHRLLNKKAVGFEEKQRKYHYFPVVDKAEFYGEKTESFLQNFFDGQLTPFISYFSQKQRISATDIAKLKALIEKMESADGE
jgi:predicted transcriptional regulator